MPRQPRPSFGGSALGLNVEDRFDSLSVRDEGPDVQSNHDDSEQGHSDTPCPEQPRPTDRSFISQMRTLGSNILQEASHLATASFAPQEGPAIMDPFTVDPARQRQVRNEFQSTWAADMQRQNIDRDCPPHLEVQRPPIVIPPAARFAPAREGLGAPASQPRNPDPARLPARPSMPTSYPGPTRPPDPPGPGGPHGPQPSRPLAPPVFKIKYDIKPSDLPAWSGQDSSFLQWAEDVDAFASTGADIARQLGEVMPTRFTDQARQWWRTLPQHERTRATSAWATLRAYIMQNFLGTRWIELQWLEFQKISFRQVGHANEDPASFLWRKVRARRVLNPPRPNDPTYDAQEVVAVMDKTPRIWASLLQLETAASVAVISQRMRDYEDQLIAHADMDQLNPDVIARRVLRQLEASTHAKKNATPVDVMTAATASGSTLKPTAYVYPFSDFCSKRKPPRACRHCGNPLHWDNECTSYKKDPSKARPYDKSVATASYLEAFAATLEVLEAGKIQNPAPFEPVDSEGPEEELEFSTPDCSYGDCVPREVLTAQLTKEINHEYIPEPSARKPPGMAALGTEALKIRCHVNSRKEQPIDAIGDSGAAITLVSRQYLEGLEHSKPKWRKGLKLNLIHITGEASCLGYVKLDLHFTSQLGPVLLSSVEAYVVDGMKSELLIGEDTQKAWQLHTMRPPTGSYWQMGDSPTRFMRQTQPIHPSRLLFTFNPRRRKLPRAILGE